GRRESVASGQRRRYGSAVDYRGVLYLSGQPAQPRRRAAASRSLVSRSRGRLPAGLGTRIWQRTRVLQSARTFSRNMAGRAFPADAHRGDRVGVRKMKNTGSVGRRVGSVVAAMTNRISPKGYHPTVAG